MKYLKIKLVGHEPVYAEENAEKSNDKQPDFKGDGVAAWTNEREEE